VDERDRTRDAERIADGDHWEQFIQASYPTVWRLCAALVGDGAADDLAQETFLRATSALPGFRGQASGRTWILAIARRVCMDELRSRYRRQRRDRHLADFADPPVRSHDAGGDLAARELLRQLEPDRRVAFALTQLFQLSYEEAAAVCDCPVGTIRSRVARARDDLIALLGHDRAAHPRHAAE
jgi:RNA polymerase sigma-70 factor, ECF subfamily